MNDHVYTEKATWKAITGAQSYTVQLYRNGLSLGSAITGVTATEYDFTGMLFSGGTTGYTFTVQAIGNGTTLYTSDVSGKSESYEYERPPKILTAPVAYTTTDTALAVFSVSAQTDAGSGMSYQWQVKNGSVWSDIDSACSYSYSFTASIADNGKEYRCIVANDTQKGKAAASPAAKLTVNSKPSVSIAPISAQIIDGESQTLTASSSGGTGTLTYSWGTHGTGASIMVSPNTTTTYTVIAKDSMGVESTASVTVTVEPKTYAIEVKHGSAMGYQFDAITQFMSYPDSDKATYTVKNTGNQSVTVTMPSNAALTIQAGTGWSSGKAVLAPGGSATLYVLPKDTDVTGKQHINVTVNAVGTLDAKRTATATLGAEYTVNPELLVHITGRLIFFTEVADSLSADVAETGTAPFSYEWAINGVVTTSTNMVQPVDISTEGSYTYTVTATDASGAQASDSTEIKVIASTYALQAAYIGASGETYDFLEATEGYQTPPLAQTVRVTNVGNRTATLTLESDSFTVSWNEGSSAHIAPGENATFTVRPKLGLAVGNYNENIIIKVATTDITATVAARFVVCPAPEASISGRLQLKADGVDTALLTANVTGGTERYTYQWSDDSGIIGSGVTLSVGPFDALFEDTSHTYYLLVTDDEGHTATAQTSVSVVGESVAVETDKAAITFAARTAGYTVGEMSNNVPMESITVTYRSGTSITVSSKNAKFKTSVASVLAGSMDINVQPVEGLSVGVHSTTLIIEADGVVITTIPVKFPVKARPSVSICGNTSVIQGGSTVLTASATGGTGALSYLWSNGSTGEVYEFTQPQSDTPGYYTYSVTVTDALGQSATAQIKIAVDSPTHVVLARPDPLSFAPVTAGYSRPAAKEVVVSNIGRGEVTMLSIQVVGDTEAFTFPLAPDKTSLKLKEQTKFTVQPNEGLEAGVYSITLTVYSHELAIDTIHTYFRVNPPPRAFIHPGNAEVVSGSTLTLSATASGGTGAYTYLWSGEGISGAGNGQSVQITAPDVNEDKVYEYSVTVKDSFGIAGIARASVMVRARTYSLSIGPSALDFGIASAGYKQRSGETLTVSNSGNSPVTIDSLPVLDGYTITPGTNWNTQGSTVLAANGGTAQFSVQPDNGLDAGDHSAVITVTPRQGGNVNVPVSFTVVGAPEISITGDISIVNGDSTTLTATVSGGIAPYSYLWSTSDTGTSITVTPSVSTEYTLNVRDSSGTEISKSITVSVVESLYTIALHPDELSFEAPYGYTVSPAAQTVTVTNTGNRSVVLIEPASTVSFTVSKLSRLTLSPGDTATFMVRPKVGLATGTHTAHILVQTTSSTSASVKATVVVANKPVSSPTPTPSAAPTQTAQPPIAPTVLPTFEPTVTPTREPKPTREPRVTPVPTVALTAQPTQTPVATPVPPVLTPVPVTPAPGLWNDITLLPEPDMDKPIDEGGLGKPEDMEDETYLAMLNALLNELTRLDRGHLDVPLNTSLLEADAIAKVEALYREIWGYKEPDKLHLLDLETGTTAVCAAFEDGKTPVLTTELISSGNMLEEAMSQVSHGEAIAIIDIKLIVDGVEVQPSGSIEITFSFKEHKNESIAIAHKRIDGTWEFFDVHVNADGYAVVIVDSLSPFVAYKAGAPTSAEPSSAPEQTAKVTPSSTQDVVITQKPEAPSLVWLIPVAVILAALITGILVLRKRK